MENRKQLLYDLEVAKTQIEGLMITDVSCFKLTLQNNQTKENKKDPFNRSTPKDNFLKRIEEIKKKREEEREKKKESKKERKQSFGRKDSSFGESPLREVLKKIKKDLYFQQEFEKILNKEKNISNWYFWKDLDKIIELKLNETNLLHSAFQKISRDYLNEESPHEVKQFLLFFFFYFFFFILFETFAN